MTRFREVCEQLAHEPKTWLVTGAAGFIGSNLVQRLLDLDQWVVGLDNLETGYKRNLRDVEHQVGEQRASRFRFIEGDIRNLVDCKKATEGCDVVLHQAARGSVPRSVDDPVGSNQTNVDGTINVLLAARDAGVRRVVYASSSSVYGDDASPTKREDRLGSVISPYAASKLADELYAQAFGAAYQLQCIGLRYFNVFGPRQDPNGAYAAVIPRWTELLLEGKPCELFGSADKSRDFCFVDNAVQANLLAATADDAAVAGRAYNVACGKRTRLEELFELIRARVARSAPHAAEAELLRKPERPGDIPHSLAEITKAERLLGYAPTHDVKEGLDEAVAWYVQRHANNKRRRRGSSTGRLSLAAAR